MTVLKAGTLPVARSALKVAMPSASVPAGTSSARHSLDR
jgi:hypothetical protein